MAVLSQINIYPIKSMAGFDVSNAYISKTGLAFDRQMMLIDSKGKFVTARKLPALLAFTVVLHENGTVIKAPSGTSIKINNTDFETNILVNIWRHDMLAIVAHDKINKWCSVELGLDVRLVQLSNKSERTTTDTLQPLAFSDGYPLLIIGEQSLALLNEKASEDSYMSQFRSNLVFSGDMPFIEDTWRRIKIGEVEFEFVKPCERCIMTTVDLKTFKFRKSKEPLHTLAKFRADEKGRLMFGENLIAKNEGIINVGDTIEVLEMHTSKNYTSKR